MQQETAQQKKVEEREEKTPTLGGLRVKNFRNLEELDLSFHSDFNFFFGPNAQGKTSILEAVFFISELRSFRTSELEPLIRRGETEALLAGDFCQEGLSYDLTASIFPHRKEVSLNGKRLRPFSRLRNLLPIVVFVPDSTRLFRLGPGERRDYFDHFIGLLSESYTVDVMEYQRALRQKQELLYQWSPGPISPSNREQLEIWNLKLAQLGARLITERKRATEEWVPHLCAQHRQLSGGKEEVLLSYLPHEESTRGVEEVNDLEQCLFSAMGARLGEELERCQVLVGPHRDDWRLFLGGADLRQMGSQGQHRTAVAALKLAEIEMILKRGLRPLALFDDLLSELDPGRSTLVLNQLGDCPCQVFLTSVTPRGIPLEGLKGQGFQVESGRISSHIRCKDLRL